MHIQEGNLEITPGSITRAFKPSSQEGNQNDLVVKIVSISAPDHSVIQSKIRLVVTDNNTLQECLLSSKYADALANNQLSSGDIIKIGNMASGTYSSKPIIYIKEILEVQRKRKTDDSWGSIGASPCKRKMDVISGERGTPKKEAKRLVTTIIGLNPFQPITWCIKAKVVSKTSVREYTKDGRAGKVFSIIVTDGDSKCNIIFFTEFVDAFYDKIQLYKTYEITGGTLKLANKTYNEDIHEYEIFVDRSFTITQTADAVKVVKMPKAIVKVSQLVNKINEVVSMLVVITSVGEIETVLRKKDQYAMKKRTLRVGDDSGETAPFIVWEDTAAMEFSMGDILLLEGARITEYQNTPQIGLSRDGIISFNPELPEVFKLKGWYNKNENILQTSSSVGTRKSVGGANRQVKIADVKTDCMEYATIKCTVLFISEKTLMYTSCIADNCNKKVEHKIDSPEDYYCNKCDATYARCSYSYGPSLSISDNSSSIWVSAFGDTASVLFNNLSAVDLNNLSVNDNDKYKEITQQSIGAEMIINIRGRESTYNGEPQMRYTATAIKPVDYLEECTNLLAQIKAMH
ncbi:replication factor A1 [Nematocida parisii]|uniref:Replication protein A subunit n=1 Tax=Nematocida parisii (strain ERTm3) TaxID=935791 RepID=I3EGY0_NEMP3|nr:hypothetical protein NEQG_01167 [Nematocida parisii ERTm3]KAI5130709.1 replication factor A1 [Nematocida parisii]KAI5130763.1 replication factor A1 [Nematocida parisii]KAI5144644.1 replication factor A1 [Nematocida parisii]